MIEKYLEIIRSPCIWDNWTQFKKPLNNGFWETYSGYNEWKDQVLYPQKYLRREQQLYVPADPTLLQKGGLLVSSVVGGAIAKTGNAINLGLNPIKSGFKAVQNIAPKISQVPGGAISLGVDAAKTGFKKVQSVTKTVLGDTANGISKSVNVIADLSKNGLNQVQNLAKQAVKIIPTNPLNIIPKINQDLFKPIASGAGSKINEAANSIFKAGQIVVNPTAQLGSGITNGIAGAVNNGIGVTNGIAGGITNGIVSAIGGGVTNGISSAIGGGIKTAILNPIVKVNEIIKNPLTSIIPQITYQIPKIVNPIPQIMNPIPKVAQVIQRPVNIVRNIIPRFF